MDFEKLIAKALECGATKATVIPQETVVLDPMFYDICASNSCGNFDKCWMCPPAVGEVHELMAKIRTYPRALLYQTIGEIEDSFDIEGMHDVSVRHAQVSQNIRREVQPMLPEGSFHMSCGGCQLCQRCAKRDNEPCRHPEIALPPLEGCGVDVYNTTKDTGLKYINGANTVTYFGMIMFGEEEVCPD